jgi:NADPH:quinone reductase-like Zn-dependent oxidoreductase
MARPKHMTAAVLTGHGGLEKLKVKEDVPVPEPQIGEVLIEVGACGINNTDINTRIGWYSKSISSGTSDQGNTTDREQKSQEDATWGGAAVKFPLIQGADVAGRIDAVGAGVSPARINERVLIDPWLRDRKNPENRNLAGYLGSERDGGFARYTTVPEENAIPITSRLSDAELATFPCSYSTGEHMLTRVRLKEGETILIPGSSGGVGSALVQLAKRRGARVIALTSKSKIEPIRKLGADDVLDRNQKDLEYNIRKIIPGGELQVVADVVGGKEFSRLLNLLCRGGRYVTSGAIAGPVVELDLRTLYLKDLEMHGATVMPVGIFETLVGYIENDEIRPLVAKEFSIVDIRKAQAEFLAKKHIGNLVVLPDK